MRVWGAVNHQLFMAYQKSEKSAYLSFVNLKYQLESLGNA